MSPERANICLIDDTPVAIHGLQSIFETSDHKVLLTAQTKEDALKAVDQFKEHRIEVVILDTKLVIGDSEGKEAKEVLEKIRSVAPDVKVITMSSGEPLEGGDLKMHKTYSREQLIDAVNRL